MHTYTFKNAELTERRKCPISMMNNRYEHKQDSYVSWKMVVDMRKVLLSEDKEQKLQQTSFQTQCQFELKTMREQASEKEERRRGLDMISGCAATRMMVINVVFPGVPSADLHLSPWWDASQPSQPCKYNKPVLLFTVRSITTKQRLQLWHIGWMCLLGTNM